MNTLTLMLITVFILDGQTTTTSEVVTYQQCLSVRSQVQKQTNTSMLTFIECIKMDER